MILAERIKAIVEYSKLSIPQFAKRVGFKTPQTVRELIAGNTKSLSDSVRYKILSTYPEINETWLCTGEGEMTAHVEENGKTASYTLVPLINIDSVGGMSHGNLMTSGEQYTERLIPFTEARDGDVAIYQSGDSMNPGIPSGSILLIRNVPDWKEYFGYGDVFVLWLKDDRRLTKQVKKYTPDPANYVTCHSFNPDFGDEELPKKYIREVWKVIKVLADKGW